MSNITIKIERDENEQLVTKIDSNVDGDESMKLYLVVLQTILNDKDIIADYTAAVLAFLDSQKSEEKE